MAILVFRRQQGNVRRTYKENLEIFFDLVIMELKTNIGGKFMTKKLFSVLLAIVMLLTVAPVAVFAEDDILSYLTYEFDEWYGGIKITHCDESVIGDVVIPDTIDGIPVTAICRDVFKNCANIRSIVIPASVTDLFDDSDFYGALYGCNSLEGIYVDADNPRYSSDSCGVLFSKDKTVLHAYPDGRAETEYVIPDGVTLINDSAFAYAAGLENVVIPDSVTKIYLSAFEASGILNVTIPKSVTYISSEAFIDCARLQGFTVDEDNPYFTNDAYGVLYNKDKTELVCYPMGRTETEYTVIDGVNTIGDHAFYKAPLRNVSLPDSVTSIGRNAFAYSALETFAVPDSEISISQAFRGCQNLTSIYIPDNAKIIDDGIVYLNEPLSVKEFQVSEQSQNYSSSEGVLFNKDKTILYAYPAAKTETKYAIPDGVEEIISCAFSYCTVLESIEIPDSVRRIDEAAFFCCLRLKQLSIPDSVTELGMEALYCSFSLETLSLGKNVELLDASYMYAAGENIRDLYVYNPDMVFEPYSAGYTIFTMHDCTLDEFIYYFDDTLTGDAASNDWVNEHTIYSDEPQPIDGFTIHGYEGSTAQTYAEENGFIFVPFCEHHYVEQVITPATYSHSGMSSMVCEFCGEVLENYEVPMLTIEESEEKADEKTDVSVIYPDGAFDGEAEIQVTPVSEGDAFKLISHKEGNYKVTMFDISVTVDGEKVQPNGTVLVKMPLPKGYNQNKCVVYYVADDGTMEELTTYHIKDGYVYFETDHFSYYAIVEEVEEAEDVTNRPSWMDDVLNFVQAFIDFFNKIISWFRSLFGIA